MARKHEITLESLLNDLAEDRELARETKQVSAAIAATQLTAKLIGLLVDRKEMGKPGDFDGRNEAEVIDIVRKELGEDATNAIMAALGKVEEQPALEPTHDADSTLN